MFAIKDLTFQFHPKHPPLFENFSLSLEAGCLHTLTGKNGAGKSTLFQLIEGALIPTKGSITCHGSIASVHQKYDEMIADTFTFEENLRFACLSPFPTLKPLPELNLPLPPFLEKFGIDPTLPVSHLSGGQRQILSILMTLQKRPSLLLLDEPTAALDAENSHLLFTFLHDLLPSYTLLVICHDPTLIAHFTTGQSIKL